MSLLSLIGGAIGGLGSIAGNLIGNNQAKKAVEAQNQGNMQLAEYAFDKNLEMWNLQNAYNTPLQQMERFKDAGLNPNLVYGQGSPGNASSAPQYDAPQMHAYTNFGDYGIGESAKFISNGLTAYQDYKLKDAQIEQVRQNTTNMQTQNEYLELRKIQQMAENAKSQEEAKMWRDILESKIANLDSGTDLNISKANNLDVDTARNEILLPYVEQQVQNDIAFQVVKLGLTKAQTNMIYKKMETEGLLQEIAMWKVELMGQEYDFLNNTQGSRERAIQLKEEGQRIQNKINKILADDGVNLKGGTGSLSSFMLNGLRLLSKGIHRWIKGDDEEQ